MKTNLWINPFEKLAGWSALGLGLAIMALTAAFGKLNSVWFDGVLDIHGGVRTQSWGEAFLMQGINWFAAVVCLSLAGLLFARSRFRLIDVAGTLAFARAPMLLLSALCFLPLVPLNLYDMPRVIFFVLLGLGAVVWMVVLMYQAYSISCNIAGPRGAWSFVGALFAAEGLSKLLFFLLLTSPTLSVPAAAQQPTPAGFEIPAEQTIQQSAAVVMKAFAEEDFAAITPYLDEKMRQAMPEAALATLWKQLQARFGAYVKSDAEVEPTEHQGYRLLFVPCEFKKQSIRLQFTFDEEGRIAGLFIK